MERLNIVRRVDDLGRIVIPKELRKKMQLDKDGGDAMEMWLDNDGNLVMRKYVSEQ